MFDRIQILPNTLKHVETCLNSTKQVGQTEKCFSNQQCFSMFYRKTLTVWTGLKKTHVVVIYRERRGTYLGSRVTKYCNNCKVYEHHGYWTMEGERKFETDCPQKEFLLSSDRAVDLSLLRQFANLLVVGAVPFSTYAKSYNRRFGYLNKLDTADDFSVDEKGINDEKENKVNGIALFFSERS